MVSILCKQLVRNESVACLNFKHSQHAWGPSVTWERIRMRYRATLATPESTPVNDAGALAPVVFSGEHHGRSCKIGKIKAKERPSHPNSTPADSMVPLFWPENDCTGSFEEDNQNGPSNGRSLLLRKSLHAMHQMHSNECPEFTQTIKNN